MIKENFCFTQLFKSIHGYSRIYSGGGGMHPFKFQENNLNHLIESGTKDIYDIYLEIKEAEKISLSIVEIETSLLSEYNSQIKYINRCIEILIKLHNRTFKKEYEFFNQFDYYPLVNNSIKNLIIEISKLFAHLLSPYNRDYYFSLIEIKKPLLSFRIKKAVRDEHFFQLSQEYMVQGGFISSSDILYFKSLFEARRLEQKINWLGPKNTLCYFIKLLQRTNVIHNHSHSHWEVTAEFFLLKGRPLFPKQLLNQPKPENKIKINTLENFVGLLL